MKQDNTEKTLSEMFREHRRREWELRILIFLAAFVLGWFVGARHMWWTIFGA